MGEAATGMSVTSAAGRKTDSGVWPLSPLGWFHGRTGENGSEEAGMGLTVMIVGWCCTLGILPRDLVASSARR